MIWVKTPVGRAEVQLRAQLHDRHLCAVLVLIDGKQSEEGLLRNLPGTSRADLHKLDELGLITPRARRWWRCGGRRGRREGDRRGASSAAKLTLEGLQASQAALSQPANPRGQRASKDRRDRASAAQAVFRDRPSQPSEGSGLARLRIAFTVRRTGRTSVDLSKTAPGTGSWRYPRVPPLLSRWVARLISSADAARSLSLSASPPSRRPCRLHNNCKPQLRGLGDRQWSHRRGDRR